MGNTLEHEKRVKVLNALVTGNGNRATAKLTGVHQDTIARFAFRVGVGCARLHDRIVRDIACAYLDFDEQHSWVGVRAKNVDPSRHDESVVGEQWTWAAQCRTSRLTVAWHVGKRDAVSANIVVADARSRLSVMPQITTDGCALYEEPIARHFGYGVDYAQQIKRFSGRGGGATGVAEKFSPGSGVSFIEKRVIFGAPNLDAATTYAIERSNGTNRCWNSRLVRRTLCFSKKLDNHIASVALQYVYRNLCHIPRNARETAAMSAGITSELWSVEMLMLAALDEPEGEKPAAKPLRYRTPETTARPLPNGRGFLRAVPSTSPGPAPSPGSSPPVEPAPAAPMPAAPFTDASGQLDLLAWRPRPAKPLPPVGSQLSLFGEDA